MQIYLLLSLQPPDFPISPEIQTHENPRERQEKVQKRAAASFPGSKDRRQKPILRLRRHKRLEHPVHQDAAGEIPQRDREKL